MNLTLEPNTWVRIDLYCKKKYEEYCCYFEIIIKKIPHKNEGDLVVFVLGNDWVVE